jgi:hypothetical protein
MGFSRLGANTTLSAQIAEAKIREAMQELRRRHVRVDENCFRCNFDGWNIDLLEIPATSLMATAPSLPPPPNYILTGATNLPVLSIVCQRCGYTVLHNLQVLGISLR